MKVSKAVLALLLAGWCIAAIAWRAKAGELRIGLSFDSTALDKPLRYSLYLPDAYASEPKRRFPVVYLLHGYGANDREWIELGRIDRTLDRMIGTGDIPPVIAVMPYGAKSWYVDSATLGGPGDYESAIASDLISHIDASYRTIADRRSRFIAGLSMGGYGALRMAFFHPDHFAAVASLSGALFQTPQIPGESRLPAEAEDRAEFWYGGAYGRPFDPVIFMRQSPFSRIAVLKEQPDLRPRILIMSGDDDYFGFYGGSAALFASLRRAGISAELRIEDGGHDWRLWRRQLPEVMRFLTSADDKTRAGR